MNFFWGLGNKPPEKYFVPVMWYALENVSVAFQMASPKHQTRGIS